jgi:hypothetical protein
MKNILSIILCALITGCATDEYAPSFNMTSVEGYQPLYSQSTDLEISISEAIPISLAGKIYVYGDLLLVNEVGQGIHVFDNKDKFNPQKKYFINIPGNRDVAIKDGILFADSFTNLLAIKIAADSAFVIKQINNVTASVDEFPPARGVYFECIVASKGQIVRWDLVTLENPECYRP